MTAAKREPLAVLASKIAGSMAHDCEVVLELRTRPKRSVRGKVTRRWIDESVRIPPKSNGQRSNLMIDIAGETIPLERVAVVKVQQA